METKNILIVDDEPLAQELLETYIARMPGLQLIAKCSNALEAFGILSKQQVDIMLLDVNMPEITGIDFLKTLKNPPAIIFTTAYTEYALESYELNAVDYLLKPITFDRFVKAINKVSVPGDASKHAAMPVTATRQNDFLFVKSDGRMVKIDLAHLWLVEGLKNYIRLWTEHGKVIVHSTMKNFEDYLAGFPGFLRVNKSYIINLKYVSEIDGNVIRLKGEMITIGNTYKDEVNRLFDSFKLQ